MANIPNDILCGILLQQPLKSLVRHKFVCNNWQNYITGSDFVKLHQKISVENPESNALLIFISEGSLYIAGDLTNSYSSILRPTKLALPPAFEGDNTTRLVGSCNGLVCLGSGNSLNSYVLFNPTNPRAFKIVPFAQNVLSTNNTARYYSCNVVAGFGYDEKSDDDDYKIVYIWCLLYQHHIIMIDRVEGMIYSTKSGSWKPLHPPNVGNQWTYFGTLNNSLHFFTEKKDVIFCFDLHDQVWSEIPFPHIQDHYTVKDTCIIEGCLSISLVRDCGDEQELWVMKEYGVKESWIELFNLPVFEGTCRILFYSTIRAQEFLLYTDRFGLVWYNIETEEINYGVNRIEGNFDISDMKMIIGSLVSIGSKRKGLARGGGRRLQDNLTEAENVDENIAAGNKSLSRRKKKGTRKGITQVLQI
ncbi:F-box protein CPR1-like [Spinacia oleracea]|uniref:F-box protein CPR1-like n=1 Tax=Spinacia oleracea TaxID=3562 RepID=A0A9R0HXY2_SPIOL|nr:F-box protein CPR1-like [Spinacia oleracea]